MKKGFEPMKTTIRLSAIPGHQPSLRLRFSISRLQRFRILDFILHPSSFILAVLLAGCAVGPDYKRPAVEAPDAFRRAASDTNAPAGEQSFADVGWWETFKDPQLNAYLAEALTNSWDIKIAAARVLQAEANQRIVRSQFFPSINAGGDLYTTRFSQKGG